MEEQRHKKKISPPYHFNHFIFYHNVLLPVILLVFKLDSIAQATSINYGIAQQPITDLSLLMPTLCQNQSVICEGSFCIPGVRKCVCDLRKPVQIGRFCLRQIDIETKCFATSQCNHTIKDAVCTDLYSNKIMNIESSKFKLEYWQNLEDIRQASRTAKAALDVINFKQTNTSTVSPIKAMFLVDHVQEDSSFQAHDDVILSNVRNSPYEINYYTPELLKQNHTRRLNESSEKNLSLPNLAATSTPDTQNDGEQLRVDENTVRSSSNSYLQSMTPLGSTTQQTVTTYSADAETPLSNLAATVDSTQVLSSSLSSIESKNENNPTSSTPSTSTIYIELPKKKKISTKASFMPPGVCSCPPGHMFDSMLRKCLALSLADSHCANDNDCRQISLTHCSGETKKCECDEPLVWNSTDLACIRPKRKTTSAPKKAATPLLKQDFLPEPSTILVIFMVVFVITVIVATLTLLGLVLKCTSTSKPALISPKNQKAKKGNLNSLPKSPYATLRKTDKPNAQMNSFTQATRGRILNYDFEQDKTVQEVSSSRPASALDCREEQPSHDHVTMERCGETLARFKGLKQNLKSTSSPDTGNTSKHMKNNHENILDESLDLNELDSETKSEHSILAPPQPTTNQPTYMLAGQQSAIAAAAAAVANRRNFGKPEFV